MKQWTSVWFFPQSSLMNWPAVEKSVKLSEQRLYGQTSLIIKIILAVHFPKLQCWGRLDRGSRAPLLPAPSPPPPPPPPPPQSVIQWNLSRQVEAAWKKWVSGAGSGRTQMKSIHWRRGIGEDPLPAGETSGLYAAIRLCCQPSR